MSKVFDLSCLIFEVSMPWAVLLSVLMMVGGCGWPSSSKAVLMGTAVLLLCYIPMDSASAADDMTLRMVLHSVWMGPLGVGFGVVLVKVILSLR